jgi:pimeloyl-ACP methyl ester carboxylesterase
MSAFILTCLMAAGVSGQTESSRPFSEHFVEANGVRLHYLDWGGQGEPVVFRTGFGTPAATFRWKVPHARVITYQDAGHYFYLDRSADVLAEIKSFYGALR